MLTMGKQSNTLAGRRYVVRTMAFMGGYVAVMLATIGGAFDAIQGKPAAWVLALVVSAPIAGQIWATLNRPAVIGHSMGGLAGLMLAQQHPEVVGRVMSVDSLPFFSAMFGPTATVEGARPFADQAAAAILGADAAGFRQQQEQTAVGMMKIEAARPAMVEWSMASDRHAMASAIREVMTTDVRPGLAAMTTPVWAVYAADADGGAPAAMADGLWGREYAALPGVKLLRVDDARHFIMMDQPERLGVLVDEFLAD